MHELTHKHWYELNPSRLEMEKMAMAAFFPEFEYDEISVTYPMLLCKGTLSSKNLKGNYEVRVLYTDGKIDMQIPEIYIVPIKPSFQELIPDCNPELEKMLVSNVALQDENTLLVLNIEQEHVDGKINTAATVLKKAISLFERYEVRKEEISQDSRKARIRKELLKGLTLLTLNGPIKLSMYNYANDSVWWQNIDVSDSAFAALAITFPQFTFEIKDETTTYPHSFRGSFITINEKVLVIRGLLSPQLYQKWEYKISITCKLWSIIIEFDKESSAKVLRQLYQSLHYMPNLYIGNQTWFNKSPVELIQLILNWIVDVESLLKKSITVPDFELKYGKGKPYEIVDIPAAKDP